MDATFSIQMAVYSILEATVSKAIHDEIEKNGKVPPVPIEQMLAGILQDNMDRLEKSCYVTQTPDKTYLAGGWLMRPAWNGERMIPMIELLKQQIDCTNVVFLPQEDGVALRKKLWDKPINEIMEKMDLFPDFKDI